MNAFRKLLHLSAARKKAVGVEHTPAEIAQQPAVWSKTSDLLIGQSDRILAFMRDSGLAGRRRATVVLAGAGTSEFIGNAIAPALSRRLQREVISAPTTHIVTHASTVFLPRRPYVLISFARSGNSPESLAAYRLAGRECPAIRHLVITCNPKGALARATRADRHALCVVLPEETNDRSLAMTSSFSTMALTGSALSLLGRPRELADVTNRLGAAADRVMSVHGDALAAFARLPFARACYLGSNTLVGTMQECHLKMTEMTDGRVACRFDSFLGLRHGPQVFVNRQCVVIAAVSSDPHVRRYEMDLLRDLRQKRQGLATLVICDRISDEIRKVCTYAVDLFPTGRPVHDDFRVMTDVVVGQILAVFKSMHLGLKPDNPSPAGTINRVVQGVRIYR